MTQLNVRASQTKRQGKEGWEGRVEFVGLSNAKVSKKDGDSFFETRSALSTASRNLAKRFGMELNLTDPVSKTIVKKAAKKSSTKVTKKPAGNLCIKTNV